MSRQRPNPSSCWWRFACPPGCADNAITRSLSDLCGAQLDAWQSSARLEAPNRRQGQASEGRRSGATGAVRRKDCHSSDPYRSVGLGFSIYGNSNQARSSGRIWRVRETNYSWLLNDTNSVARLGLCDARAPKIHVMKSLAPKASHRQFAWPSARLTAVKVLQLGLEVLRGGNDDLLNKSCCLLAAKVTCRVAGALEADTPAVKPPPITVDELKRRREFSASLLAAGRQQLASCVLTQRQHNQITGQPSHQGASTTALPSVLKARYIADREDQTEQHVLSALRADIAAPQVVFAVFAKVVKDNGQDLKTFDCKIKATSDANMVAALVKLTQRDHPSQQLFIYTRNGTSQSWNTARQSPQFAPITEPISESMQSEHILAASVQLKLEADPLRRYSRAQLGYAAQQFFQVHLAAYY